MARQMKNVRGTGHTIAKAYDASISMVKCEVAKIAWSAAQATAGTATAVHAAAACALTEQTVNTSITNPTCARNVTATTTGTSGDVAAVSVVVYGTNIMGESISETLPAFTVNTNETVAGSKAFLTVTSYVVPAMDGTGCNVSIGVGEKLGLPAKFSRNPVLRTFLGGALEGTAATVAVSSSAYESNTIDLNSALNGSAVIAEVLVNS